LQLALQQRQPAAGLVHHADRGSEYTSKTYQEMLQQHNIQVSMSKKGDCYDNAVIESFWGTLKEECVGRNVYKTRKEAKTSIFDYIEVFYNRKRKHSTLGYLSPDTYEKESAGDKT
jgi:transposase InsO family protein